MAKVPSLRFSLFIVLAAGCTGLVAGPESRIATPVPASRDSAYVRARRALQGESFTLDVVDSSGGRLSGTRWPSSSAKQGSSAACHVTVALQVQGDANRSEVTTVSSWVAPGGMSKRGAQGLRGGAEPGAGAHGSGAEPAGESVRR
jgi:hypothetical protein